MRGPSPKGSRNRVRPHLHSKTYDLGWLARNKDALKRSLPGARVIEVPGANVYMFLSNEADVLGELRAFLIQLGG